MSKPTTGESMDGAYEDFIFSYLLSSRDPRVETVSSQAQPLDTFFSNHTPYKSARSPARVKLSTVKSSAERDDYIRRSRHSRMRKSMGSTGKGSID